MARGERVVHNLYRDSVSLMQLSATLGRLPGVLRMTSTLVMKQIVHGRPLPA